MSQDRLSGGQARLGERPAEECRNATARPITTPDPEKQHDHRDPPLTAIDQIRAALGGGAPLSREELFECTDIPEKDAISKLLFALRTKGEITLDDSTDAAGRRRYRAVQTKAETRTGRKPGKTRRKGVAEAKPAPALIDCLIRASAAADSALSQYVEALHDPVLEHLRQAAAAARAALEGYAGRPEGVRR